MHTKVFSWVIKKNGNTSFFLCTVNITMIASKCDIINLLMCIYMKEKP